MKAKVILIISLCCFFWWSVPASARLYPPCQAIDYKPDTVNTIRYGITDPTTGAYQEETWTLTQGDEHSFQFLQADQGILTWIEVYRNTGETYYTFKVHYRIYDPGRGAWKAGSWGPFTGYSAWLGQHKVKDGVVAWTAHRAMGSSPTDMLEHWVCYATYDPKFGSWVVDDSSYWRVAYNDKTSPEDLRVKNGVVAWPMNDAQSGQCSDEHNVNFYSSIYDQELHQWQPFFKNINTADLWVLSYTFDWIEIPHDTVQVQARFSQKVWFGEADGYWGYDPTNHAWQETGEEYSPQRRACCVAAPDSGVVPLRSWFWDCSTALDGTDVPSSYGWTINNSSDFLYARSLGYTFTSLGPYIVNEWVYNSGYFVSYTAWAPVTVQAPAPPSGGISINNGATYTTSVNVTLSLNPSPSATEMCFRQAPGLFLWSNWEPVAASKAWTLSTMRVGGTPDGPHTVWVKFRDGYGSESSEYQNTITLDITPPAVTLTLNDGAATTHNPSVTVQWSASDAIGLGQMSYASINEGETIYMWSPPLNFFTPEQNFNPPSRIIKFSSKPGRKTVMVRFIDAAGNITHTQASIQLKPASLPLLFLLLGN